MMLPVYFYRRDYMTIEYNNRGTDNMAEATWEVTENDRIIARDGVELQFRSLKIEEFINNEVEVIA